MARAIRIFKSNRYLSSVLIENNNLNDSEQGGRKPCRCCIGLTSTTVSTRKQIEKLTHTFNETVHLTMSINQQITRS